jgi:transketolase
MRNVISEFLTTKAKQNSNFYVLSGDHGYALFDGIRKEAPNQFVNVGVSEQAMVGYASGMTKQGLKVVVYGLSAFVPIRVLEFIKMDICYENLPVVFLGDGAGLVYATLGPSHQCAEDIACMRTLPHMNIYSPADSFEMEACLEKAFNNDSPSYIRIGKADKSLVHDRKIHLDNAAFFPIRVESSSVAIVATGSMVATALEIGEKNKFAVFSAPELTNLNQDKILEQLNKFSLVVTVEEHSVNGGLGSILCEIFSERPSGKRIVRIGINNRFTAKCGSYEYAIKEHGLDYEGIISQLKINNVIE